MLVKLVKKDQTNITVIVQVELRLFVIWLPLGRRCCQEPPLRFISHSRHQLIRVPIRWACRGACISSVFSLEELHLCPPPHQHGFCVEAFTLGLQRCAAHTLKIVPSQRRAVLKHLSCHQHTFRIGVQPKNALLPRPGS